MALAIAFLILMVAAPAAVYGAEHTVGDTQGWNQGVNYDTWASGNTFTVGDTLVFNYDSSHKVDEVNLADYNGCSSSNSIKTYEDSPTNITLSKAGPSYYICPISGHCASGGMKLLVNVVAAGTPSGTPPTTTPATPAPPTTTTPANNDSPPPPPPPPKISPASSLHMNLVGVPLMLATLMAVMG